jgi:hypothetical protein
MLMNPDTQDAILAIDLYAAFANGSNGEREREQLCQLAYARVFQRLTPGARLGRVVATGGVTSGMPNDS